MTDEAQQRALTAAWGRRQAFNGTNLTAGAIVRDEAGQWWEYDREGRWVMTDGTRSAFTPNDGVVDRPTLGIVSEGKECTMSLDPNRRIPVKFAEGGVVGKPVTVNVQAVDAKSIEELMRRPESRAAIRDAFRARHEWKDGGAMGNLQGRVNAAWFDRWSRLPTRGCATTVGARVYGYDGSRWAEVGPDWTPDRNPDAAKASTEQSAPDYCVHGGCHATQGRTVVCGGVEGWTCARCSRGEAKLDCPYGVVDETGRRCGDRFLCDTCLSDRLKANLQPKVERYGGYPGATSGGRTVDPDTRARIIEDLRLRALREGVPSNAAAGEAKPGGDDRIVAAGIAIKAHAERAAAGVTAGDAKAMADRAAKEAVPAFVCSRDPEHDVDGSVVLGSEQYCQTCLAAFMADWNVGRVVLREGA